MPSRAPRRCPRCRQTYRDRCLVCVPRDADYQAARTDELDAHYLKHHPWCVMCEAEGKAEPARVADHYPTSRRDLIARGIRHPDAWVRLRPLCMGHHRSETNRLQPGGFIAHPERY
jgi:5-methylcytosine-specific restriction protein A